ncbi:hypothetical protein GE061_010984 [Apolygus lucorum]|uniref:NADPH-dependent diflavin oxidoreductase 1 n=1 Tax=Apolygus lucorum TaxID=248454 RepID=A0A8S9XYT9_APOLU|nr:hypothetical protein GE061_010984 [Apolygus lucorum]
MFFFVRWIKGLTLLGLRRSYEKVKHDTYELFKTKIPKCSKGWYTSSRPTLPEAYDYEWWNSQTKRFWRLSKTLKTRENYFLKSFIGFICGVLITCVISFFCVLVLNMGAETAAAASAIVGLSCCFLLGFNDRARGSMLMFLPKVFSCEGRTLFKLYLLILITSGPVKNTLRNLRILTDSVICVQERAQNILNSVESLVKRPIIPIEESLKIVLDKVKLVRNAAKELMFTIKIAVVQIVGIIRAVFGFLNGIIKLCKSKVGSTYHKCLKSVEFVSDGCKAKLGSRCEGIGACSTETLLKELCRSARSKELCPAYSFLPTSIVLSSVKGLKKLAAHLRNMFHFAFVTDHDNNYKLYNGKGDYFRTYKKVAGITKVNSDWLDELTQVIGFSMAVYGIYSIYSCSTFAKYVTREWYDNCFITENLTVIEVNRKRLDKQGIFPLMRWERRKYTPITSFEMIGKEGIRYTSFPINYFFTAMKIVITAGFDLGLVWYLKRLHRIGHITIKYEGLRNVVVFANATGPVWSIFKASLDAFQPKWMAEKTDLTTCFANPYEPDYSRYHQIGVVFLLYTLVSFLGPHGERLRVLILERCYPHLAKRRAVWLYNHIQRIRNISVKISRRRLRRKYRDRGEDIIPPWKVILTEMKSHLIHYGDKFWGQNAENEEEANQICLNCECPYSPETLLVKCPTLRCPGLYCNCCFEEIGRLCVLCRPPREYGDLSDVSEERDSSDEDRNYSCDDDQLSELDSDWWIDGIEDDYDYSYMKFPRDPCDLPTINSSCPCKRKCLNFATMDNADLPFQDKLGFLIERHRHEEFSMCERVNNQMLCSFAPDLQSESPRRNGSPWGRQSPIMEYSSSEEYSLQPCRPWRKNKKWKTSPSKTSSTFDITETAPRSKMSNPSKYSYSYDADIGSLQLSSDSVNEYLTNVSKELEQERLLGKLDLTSVDAGGDRKRAASDKLNALTTNFMYVAEDLKQKRLMGIRKATELEEKESTSNRNLIMREDRATFWSRMRNMFSMACWRINSGASGNQDSGSGEDDSEDSEKENSSGNSTTSTGTTTVVPTSHACHELGNAKSQTSPSVCKDEKFVAAKLVESLKRFFSINPKTDEDGSRHINNQMKPFECIEEEDESDQQSEDSSDSDSSNMPSSLPLPRLPYNGDAGSALSSQTSEYEVIDVKPKHRQPILNPSLLNTPENGELIFSSWGATLQAVQRGLESRVMAMDDFPVTKLLYERLVVFVVATTGQGDPPANMSKTWTFLLRRSLPSNSLSNSCVAVLGLGDSSYVKFNFIAKKLHRRLTDGLGATPLCSAGLADDQHDLGPSAVIDPWSTELWSHIKTRVYPNLAIESVQDVSFENPLILRWGVTMCADDALATQISAAPPDENSYSVTLTSNQRTTPEDHFQDVRIFRMRCDGAGKQFSYSPGDVAYITPSNSSEAVDKFFSLFEENGFLKSTKVKLEQIHKGVLVPIQLSNQTFTLENCVRNYWDLSVIPSRSVFEVMASVSTDDLEKEKLVELSSPAGVQELYDYCNRPRRTILEVLADFPHSRSRLKLEHMFDLMKIIRPRAFSIASSPLETELILLVAVVQYRTRLKAPRIGLCSNWLKNLPTGSKLNIAIKKGSLRFPSFDPNGDESPVVMVGPGTGVAPFRSFIVSEWLKESDEEKRQLTLFFGSRNREADYFFRKDWASVHHLNVFTAFSRDQPHKIYVQHVLLEQKELIVNQLISRRGHFFVAGSSKDMPEAVRSAVKKSAVDAGRMSDEEADKWLEQMDRENRYQQEVWS